MKKKFFLKKSKLKYFYVQNPPTPKELENYYSNLYFKTNPRYSKKNLKIFEEKYFEYQTKIRLEFLRVYKKNNSSSLLDLGAGTGRFLYYSKNYIKKGIGVDFSKKQLKSIQDWVEANPDYLESDAKTEEYFTLVRSITQPNDDKNLKNIKRKVGENVKIDK